MKSKPLVSVIIPAFNAEDTIARALQSACDQTYEHLEMIVVNDGSLDATPDLVGEIAMQDRRIRLIQQANAGVAAARNRAIAVSNGSFVAPLDADDLWHPEKLERQVHLLTSAGLQAGVAYCGWEIEGVGGRRLGRAVPRHEGHVFGVLVRRNIIGCASAPLIRRACFDRVGGYDTRMWEQGWQGCEDWDLYLRIAEHYEFRAVTDPLVTYRKSPGTMSASAERMEHSYRIMQEMLKARRPDLPRTLLRESEQIFLLYLARVCSAGRDVKGALRYLARAFYADPIHALSRLPSRQSMSVFSSLIRHHRAAA